MTNEWYQNARNKGFHDNDELGPDGTPSPRQRLAWVALILTEWVEDKDDEEDGLLWEINENGKPVGRCSELADVIIRCSDTIGACGDDLIGEVAELQVPKKADPICYVLGKAGEATRTGDHRKYAALLRLTIKIATDQLNSITWNPSFRVSDALRAKGEYNRTRSRMHGKLV